MQTTGYSNGSELVLNDSRPRVYPFAGLVKGENDAA